jgi:hypothetical protein
VLVSLRVISTNGYISNKLPDVFLLASALSGLRRGKPSITNVLPCLSFLHICPPIYALAIAGIRRIWKGNKTHSVWFQEEIVI